VGRDLFFAQPRCKWLRPLTNDDDPLSPVGVSISAFGQAKLRLTRADQFDVNLGQNFGVKQRAVLGTPRAVDSVSRA